MSAVLPRWLCRGWFEGSGNDAEGVGIRASRSEGDPDATGCFDDAGSDLDEPQAQGRELRACQRGRLGDGLLNAPQEPVGSRVQDQAHLVCVGRPARGAVAGELPFVTLDQVLGLAAGAV